MKKVISLFFFLIILNISLNSQIPISLNLHAKGSEVTDLLGVEFQLSNFSISEGWRPIDENNNSFITTFTYYGLPTKSSHYVSIGFATKGLPDTKFNYKDLLITNGFDKINYTHSTVVLIGYRTVVEEMVCGKAGLGFNKGDSGTTFAFEVGISVILPFQNKPKKLN